VTDYMLRMTLTEKLFEAPLSFMLQMYTFIYLLTESSLSMYWACLSVFLSAWGITTGSYTYFHLSLDVDASLAIDNPQTDALPAPLTVLGAGEEQKSSADSAADVEGNQPAADRVAGVLPGTGTPALLE